MKDFTPQCQIKKDFLGGIQEFIKGDYVGAKTLVNSSKAKVIESNNPKKVSFGDFFLGKIYYKLGWYNESITSFLNALKKDTDSYRYDIKLELANSYRATGNYQEMAGIYYEFTTTKSSYYQLYGAIHLVSSLCYLGNKMEALDIYNNIDKNKLTSNLINPYKLNRALLYISYKEFHQGFVIFEELVDISFISKEKANELIIESLFANNYYNDVINIGKKFIPALTHKRLLKVLKLIISSYEALGSLDGMEYVDQYLELSNQLISESKVKNKELLNTSRKIREINAKEKRSLDLVKKINIIGRIGKKLAISTDLNTTLNRSLKELNTLLPLDAFGIALYNPEKDTLHYDHFFYKGKLLKGPLVKKCDPSILLAAVAVKTVESILIGSYTKEALGAYGVSFCKNNHIEEDKLVTNSIIYCPIVLKERVLGVLTFQHSRSFVYQEHHLKLAESFARYLAISLENQEKIIKLQELARRDPLTNLYNRAALEEDYSNKIADNYSSILIDIDYYKEFNDLYGHLEGDRVLRVLSSSIQKIFKNYFTVRYGGDEFLILGFGISSDLVSSSIEEFLEEVRSLDIPHIGSKLKGRLSVSIGGVCVPSKVELHELISLADKRLYITKRNFKGMASFYSFDFPKEEVEYDTE